MIRRMTHLGTFRTQKSAKEKIAELVTNYPHRTYEIRWDVGGKLYIVCTNADSLT